jgi:uroporphyrinogen-III decarboxylase
MNSLERVSAALRGETPDRVPILEWFVHQKVYQSILPGTTWPDFVEEIDLDAVTAHFIFEGTFKETRIDENTVVNEWGVTLGVTEEHLAPIDGPIKTLGDAQKYIAPDPNASHRLARVVQAVHEEGAFCVKHSDGNLWPILDMIIETGVDAINPLEPVAGMDIAEVKRRYGDRVCLIGNIDCGELLSRGTPEQVTRTVRDTIRQAAPGGGYIMSSSNTIHSSVKSENYQAMIDATHLYGTYPLTLGD